ncbi:MAG: hypothetical protein CVU61_11885 [Deltaproteobacteria bacterium HGW-Deltaproteobacteria-19]|jgi:hypothetical protein|nr:MAG: hypothetical protein CVU61_11885 [Deltaproteobacteria bacterium HGW-Deltaproteobacteria-19]
MKNNYREDDLIADAVGACALETGLDLTVEGEGVDRKILIGRQGVGIRLDPRLMPGLSRTMAIMMTTRAEKDSDRIVVVTQQVNRKLADLLRQYGIQFMDEAGNVYLNQPPLFVFVKGNVREEPPRGPVIGRIFKKTGLKVLFALLCNPGMEQEPYRVIAAGTGVALGMVNRVFQELKEQGFLLETAEERRRKARLVDRDKLLERWIAAYGEELRPKLLIGRYRGRDGWWEGVELDPALAQWGGELAAARLTGQLKPQDILLYVNHPLYASVLREHRLVKDPDGDVTLLARFWNPQAVPPQGDHVHPILVYADLLATGDQRNLEAARRIYETHIIQLVRPA